MSSLLRTTPVGTAANNGGAPTPITILLVEDHPGFRLGITTLVDRETDLELVAEVESAEEAGRLAEALRPRVIIADIKLKEGDGFAVARGVRERVPEAAILMLSSSTEAPHLKTAFRLGVHGYLSKSASIATILEAIRATARGETVYPEEMAPLISGRLEKAIRHPQANRWKMLSPRQLEVVHLIQAGLTNAEIADRLQISRRGVEAHITNLRETLGAHTRMEIAFLAGYYVEADRLRSGQRRSDRRTGG